MYCEHCGAQIKDTAKFCEFCGSAIDKKLSENDNDSASSDQTVRGSDEGQTGARTLEREKYFETVAPKESKALIKKRSKHALIAGIVVTIAFFAITLLSMIAQNGWEKAKISGIATTLIAFSVIAFLSSVAATVLSVVSIKKANLGMAVCAVLLSVFGIGIGAVVAAQIALYTSVKLNREYKKYLIETEGVKY